MSKCKVTVHDRVYLNVPGKRIVIELIDGYDASGVYQDGWRVIDINTGEEFYRDENLHDVIHQASLITCEAQDDHYDEYIVGRPPEASYRKFKDLPLNAKMMHVAEHAQDLEHDFKLDGDTRCPFTVAMEDFNSRYNEKPCFYLDRESHIWQLDMDRA